MLRGGWGFTVAIETFVAECGCCFLSPIHSREGGSAIYTQYMHDIVESYTLYILIETLKTRHKECLLKFLITHQFWIC